jgi:hypothetical protein
LGLPFELLVVDVDVEGIVDVVGGGDVVVVVGAGGGGREGANLVGAGGRPDGNVDGKGAPLPNTIGLDGTDDGGVWLFGVDVPEPEPELPGSVVDVDDDAIAAAAALDAANNAANVPLDGGSGRLGAGDGGPLPIDPVVGA